MLVLDSGPPRRTSRCAEGSLPGHALAWHEVCYEQATRGAGE
jgi:hypothetical protein